MKTRRLIALMLALVLLLSLTVLAASAKGVESARVYQSPVPTPTPGGGPRSAAITFTAPVPNPGLVGGEVVFEMGFAVANIVPGMTGAEVYVSYNPALVMPPTSPGSVAAEVLPNFFGSSNVSVNEILPAASCPGGASPCIHLVVAGPAQTTKTGAAARFHFQGLAEGTACFSVLQSVLVDADGFQIQHTPPAQQCVTIQFRASANGVVTRQGVPANPNPGGGNWACTAVTATGVGSFGPVNTDATGNFSIGNLPIGTYTFRAVYPGYLASERAGVIVDGSSITLNIGAARLRGGDVNGDNAINILDVGTIIGKFGQTGVAVKSASVNCSGADEAADVNDDGLINISDLAIAAGNWGAVAPQPWTP